MVLKRFRPLVVFLIGALVRSNGFQFPYQDDSHYADNVGQVDVPDVNNEEITIPSVIPSVPSIVPIPTTTPAVIPTPAITPAIIDTPTTPAVIPTPAITPAVIDTPTTTPAVIPTPAITPAVINTPTTTPAVIATPTTTPAVITPAAPAVSPLDSKLVESTESMRTLAAPRNVAPALLKERAIPTNNWWGNLIAYDVAPAIQPVWVNPYTIAVKTVMAPYGMQISYPFATRTEGGQSGNGAAARFYLHSIRNDIMFSANEFAETKPTFEVVDWSDMGVTFELRATPSALMSSHLVSGMAYVTTTYTGLVPRITSSAAITGINGKAVDTNGGTVSGDKLTIEYNSGQTWVVYALNTDSQGMTWTVQNATLVASASFSGTLRAALVTDPKAGQEAVLDKYKDCIVSSAAINPTDDRSYTIQWNTTGNCQAGLLHYALSHQVETMDSSTAITEPSIVASSTTRGLLHGFVSKTHPPTWTLNEPDSFPIDFYPDTKLAPQVAQEQRLLEHLKADIAKDLDFPLGGSFYFNGKMAQKYASLCLMAKDPAIVGSDTTLLETCLTKLKQGLTPFLTNSWTNKLQYDAVYRGIVSSEGFLKNDINADFGNTVYNDHHYHFGYWIMAAAIVNELAPSWDQIGALNSMAGLLARDVATFDRQDTYFPRFRSFDWYRGHSYSHGVTAMADGKDEESTSEDINFAYALAMFGKATNNKRMEQVGRLMTKLLARSIQTYFQVQPNSDVHPVEFRPNYVTGIYFDNKVDYGTWFSPKKECIHGIQMLPFSPLTPHYRSKTFVSEEWSQVLSKVDAVTSGDQTNAWLSILYTSYASVDAAKAMSVLQTVTMDDGLSRAWALYMAATRPQL